MIDDPYRSDEVTARPSMTPPPDPGRAEENKGREDLGIEADDAFDIEDDEDYQAWLSWADEAQLRREEGP